MAYEGYTHHGSITCHTSPTMTLDYGVNDDGNYAVTVNKSNTSDFGYTWTVKLNDNSDIIIKSNSDGDGKAWTKTCTGNCGSVFKLSAVCGAGSSGCAMGGNYILVNTINLHTHSAPTGFKLSISDIKQESAKVSWSCESSGCSGISKWAIKGIPGHSDFTDKFSGVDDSPVIKELTPNKSYTFSGYCTNGHGYQSNVNSVTFKTKPNKPIISCGLNPDNIHNGKEKVSAGSGYFQILATNTASHTGELEWKVEFRPKGSSTWILNKNNEDIFHITIDPNETHRTGGSWYEFKITATCVDDSSIYSTVQFSARTKYNSNNFTTNVNIKDIGLEHIIVETECYEIIDSKKSKCIKDAVWGLDNILKDENDATCNGSMAFDSNHKSIINTADSTILEPSSTHKINIKIIMNSDYDDVVIFKSISATTDGKNVFTQIPGNCIFQLPGTPMSSCTIQSPSGNKALLEFSIWIELTTGEITYLDIKRIEVDNIISTKTVNLNFTDEEWDTIYKMMPANSNIASYHLSMQTYSILRGMYVNDNNYSVEIDGTITLTGNKKTTHVGKSGPKRARVYIGDSSKNVRKAVCWVGIKDSDGVVRPHRTI